jgi:hypothetical protein
LELQYIKALFMGLELRFKRRQMLQRGQDLLERGQIARHQETKGMTT